ncbi:MAG: nucleotidyltransferase family protein [Bacteroidaceae bacterium]|nr:nucleotidyltransferase family protein [Bacteroidaceae bacterium]
MKNRKTFFELISISLGHKEILSYVPTPEEWDELFSMAMEQTLLGVLYGAIERLPKEQLPPKKILFHWYRLAEEYKSENQRMNAEAVELCKFFEDQGFDCAIMKGQAVALYYPDPLRRTCGDIDIWIAPKGMAERGGKWLSKSRKCIYDFMRARKEMEGINYQHVHLHIFPKTSVEVHITPSSLYNFLHNYRLQRFFEREAAAQFNNRVLMPDGAGEISALTLEFNRFFILQHIYGHFFGEGVGLRQLLDYYYVLRQGGSEDSKERTMAIFRRVGMERFVAATMWLLQKVFGLEDKYLLCTPNQKEGEFLLKEVLLAGNFGKYDSRFDRSRYNELIPRLWNSLKRKARLVTRYPHEILFDLPFRTWLYFWRMTLKR